MLHVESLRSYLLAGESTYGVGWRDRSVVEREMGRALGENEDDAPSPAGETVSGGAEKKRTRNVNSAEALSSRTKDSERKSASTGCLCNGEKVNSMNNQLHSSTRDSRIPCYPLHTPARPPPPPPQSLQTSTYPPCPSPLLPPPAPPLLQTD